MINLISVVHSFENFDRHMLKQNVNERCKTSGSLAPAALPPLQVYKTFFVIQNFIFQQIKWLNVSDRNELKRKIRTG